MLRTRFSTQAENVNKSFYERKGLYILASRQFFEAARNVTDCVTRASVLYLSALAVQNAEHMAKCITYDASNNNQIHFVCSPDDTKQSSQLKSHDGRLVLFPPPLESNDIKTTDHNHEAMSQVVIFSRHCIAIYISHELYTCIADRGGETGSSSSSG